MVPPETSDVTTSDESAFWSSCAENDDEPTYPKKCDRDLEQTLISPTKTIRRVIRRKKKKCKKTDKPDDRRRKVLDALISLLDPAEFSRKRNTWLQMSIRID